jgi:hypothetical protein
MTRDFDSLVAVWRPWRHSRYPGRSFYSPLSKCIELEVKALFLNAHACVAHLHMPLRVGLDKVYYTRLRTENQTFVNRTSLSNRLEGAFERF